MNENSLTISQKPVIGALNGECRSVPPIWLMRQAGRHLEEYRQVRKTAGDFLELVCSPGKATEVTLQPVRRYELDGSILFSDILVVPWAMGQDLQFEAGQGPTLGPLPKVFNEGLERLLPIYETLRHLALELEKTSVAQLGFVGAPWTVITYMIERKKPRFKKSRDFLQTDLARPLFDRVIQATISYARKQVEAGAEAIMIFDSWAGELNGKDIPRWSFEPMAMIGESLSPTPVIYFPRGCHTRLGDLLSIVSEPFGIALGEGTDISVVREAVGPKVCLQGNLNPKALLGPEAEQERAVALLLDQIRGTPHIFNLGHGLDKATDPVRVKALVEQVRSG